MVFWFFRFVFLLGTCLFFLFVFVLHSGVGFQSQYIKYLFSFLVFKKNLPKIVLVFLWKTNNNISVNMSLYLPCCIVMMLFVLFVWCYFCWCKKISLVAQSFLLISFNRTMKHAMLNMEYENNYWINLFCKFWLLVVVWNWNGCTESREYVRYFVQLYLSC